MKQMIIMLSMIILGIFIYELILGDGDSLMNTISQMWQAGLDERSLYGR